ncbi:hypothetical protein [Nocardiopsis synnemataformans]|uniref:hypothetical protein n=1 Tax=Nocardiopsis synnemataformans TaxID=61305 RepID=UPI003EBC6C7C
MATRRRTAGFTRTRPLLLGASTMALAAVLGSSIWAYADDRSGAAPDPADHAPRTAEENGRDMTVDANSGGDVLSSLGEELGLTPPSGWYEVDVRVGNHDGERVTVTRHQPTEEVRLGGPHVSVVRGGDGRVVGYTALDPDVDNDPGDLPDAEQARQAAYSWLGRLDDDYLQGLSEQWVDRHDETVVDEDGREHVIPGVKVKTRHEDGRYAWVIVGADSRVMTFERDVTWDTAAQRRATQMWLHDAWIAALEGSGEQPPPPAALADGAA